MYSRCYESTNNGRPLVTPGKIKASVPQHSERMTPRLTLPPARTSTQLCQQEPAQNRYLFTEWQISRLSTKFHHPLPSRMLFVFSYFFYLYQNTSISTTMNLKVHTVTSTADFVWVSVVASSILSLKRVYIWLITYIWRVVKWNTATVNYFIHTAAIFS